MLFSAIAVSAATLVASVASAATPVIRYGTLRLYSEQSCGSTSNLGELGVYNDQINTCQTFGDNVVRSLRLESNPYFCSLEIYDDAACSLNQQDVPLDQCLSANDVYGSYKLVCGV